MNPVDASAYQETDALHFKEGLSLPLFVAFIGPFQRHLPTPLPQTRVLSPVRCLTTPESGTPKGGVKLEVSAS